MPELDGLRPLPVRIANKYVDQVLAAAESDIVVAEQFARVIGFLGPPTRRVATTNSAGGKAITQPPKPQRYGDLQGSGKPYPRSVRRLDASPANVSAAQVISDLT